MFHNRVFIRAVRGHVISGERVAPRKEIPNPVPGRLFYCAKNERDRAGKVGPLPETAGKSSWAAPAEGADAQTGTGFGEARTSHVARVQL